MSYCDGCFTLNLTVLANHANDLHRLTKRLQAEMAGLKAEMDAKQAEMIALRKENTELRFSWIAAVEENKF